MRTKKRSLRLLLSCILACLTAPSAWAQAVREISDVRAEPFRQVDQAALADVKKPEVKRLPDTEPCCEAAKAKAATLEKSVHLRRAAEHLVAAGKIELAGQVEKEALLEEKLRLIRRLQAEVNELRATTLPDQTLLLDVKLMELQISKMHKLGFDWQTANGWKDGKFTDSGGGQCVESQQLIEGFISALREHGLVEVLAEPTLVVSSGRPASFRSGGEFPILVPQGQGRVAVEYREFGTRVDCVAEVQPNGRIRLEVRPSVSEIDASRSVKIHDTTVPGLRTRKMDTAVEMDLGQTLFLRGLTLAERAEGDGAADVSKTALLLTVTVNEGEPVKHTKRPTGTKIR